MKLHDLQPAPGSRTAKHARRPRHRGRQGQDRRPRHQGPEVARRRRDPGLVRGRPDADPHPHPQAARLQEPRRDRVRGRQRRRRSAARDRAPAELEVRRQAPPVTVNAEILRAAGLVRGDRAAQDPRPGRACPSKLFVRRRRVHEERRDEDRGRRRHRPGPRDPGAEPLAGARRRATADRAADGAPQRRRAARRRPRRAKAAEAATRRRKPPSRPTAPRPPSRAAAAEDAADRRRRRAAAAPSRRRGRAGRPTPRGPPSAPTRRGRPAGRRRATRPRSRRRRADAPCSSAGQRVPRAGHPPAHPLRRWGCWSSSGCWRTCRCRASTTPRSRVPRTTTSSSAAARPVLGRRPVDLLDRRDGREPVHQRLDHHAADDGRRARLQALSARRRVRPQQDQPVHALPDRADGPAPGLRLPGDPERRSGLLITPLRHPQLRDADPDGHPDAGHRARDVDRRADHRDAASATASASSSSPASSPASRARSAAFLDEPRHRRGHRRSRSSASWRSRSSSTSRKASGASRSSTPAASAAGACTRAAPRSCRCASTRPASSRSSSPSASCCSRARSRSYFTTLEAPDRRRHRERRSSASSTRTRRSTSSLYFLLTVGFTYFYTAFTFKPDETADQLRKNGGFIPGIRPGPPDRGTTSPRSSSGSPSPAPCSWASSPCRRSSCRLVLPQRRRHSPSAAPAC